MPNQPKTPIRSVRVPVPLWDEAATIAAHRGETLSDIMRTALVRYVRRHRTTTPKE